MKVPDLHQMPRLKEGERHMSAMDKMLKIMFTNYFVHCDINSPVAQNMMGRSVLAARMKKELEMLRTDPPHGVSAWPKDDSLNEVEAGMIHCVFGCGGGALGPFMFIFLM
jgi:hypothetical protein